MRVFKNLAYMALSLVMVPAFVLFSAQARAEFKCDAPSTRIDRVACEKAAESPQALSQYIQRMRAIENLYFPDYVNEARALAWAQNESSRAPASNASAQTAKFSAENPGA